MSPRRIDKLPALLIAADNSRGFRPVLEWCAVAAILLILNGSYAHIAENTVTKATLTEGFMLATTARVDLVTFRAQHGRWPSPGDSVGAELTETGLGRYVDRIELGRGGAMTIVFGASPDPAVNDRRLALRPGAVAGNATGPVAWHCGRWRPPAGVVVAADDETDIPEARLPGACREP